MVNMTAMLMVMQVREDEEVKAQLIQRIDNLSADNDCLKSEMDLVRNRNTKYNNLKICTVKMVSKQQAKMAKSNVFLTLKDKIEELLPKSI